MMIVNYREKMREYLKEPNEICNHYGKWGILNKEQRDLITRLLNEMDGADNYIIKLQQENARLKELEQSLIFIKNRVKQGMTQEEVNKCAIHFVNSYLKNYQEN